ncbi:MAG: rhomboid family intramembrane serine protease [Clostridia bacterium]|nr:rhomboid family intramembrane serine protease [Clostridia bacterium]
MKKWLNALERHLYKYNIPPIMKYLVFAMGGVFVLDLFMVMTTAYTTHINLISYMTLDVTMVLQGQVWRLLTWLIVPNQDNMLWMALSLYFYYFIGTALESRWGARRFLIFFVIGAIANIAAAFLSHAITGYGYGVNTYLYFSLFLAFAALYPDMQFMLFFVLPIKAKWLAAVDLVYFLMAIVMGGVSLRMAAIASLVNILLFFGEDIWQTGRRMYFQWQRRRQFRR